VIFSASELRSLILAAFFRLGGLVTRDAGFRTSVLKQKAHHLPLPARVGSDYPTSRRGGWAFR